MADISDKADEFAGRAKQAAGKLTGNDELRAEGTVDEAKANVKQGVDAVADKAEEAVDAAASKAEDVKESVSDAVDTAQNKLSDIADKTADTARQLHLDEAAEVVGDNRTAISAALAAIALIAVAVVIRRKRSADRPLGRRAAKKAAKKAAAGVGHAFNR